MEESVFKDIFSDLGDSPARHRRDRPSWRLLDRLARIEVQKMLSADDAVIKGDLGPLGAIDFPYIEMGNINSLDLFGLDELIIFAFYLNNRDTYRRVADFGANLGLHSLVLGRCGFEVRSFEPDPRHFQILKDSLSRNGVTSDLQQKAVSTEDGVHEFVRVLGNTTGSHLSGAKKDPYGELERFEVQIVDATSTIKWADLVKIDIEGHEADLLTNLPIDLWSETDAIMEVGTTRNAEQIFERFNGTPVNLFAQKIEWERVTSVSDIPTSHREGSLFLSTKLEMPW